MELSDEFLMVEVQKGKLEKLGVLFDRYNKRMYNYFLKSTLDSEESGDLTQNVFIRVLKYRGSYKEGNNVESWMFQIARNLVKDHFRKMKVMKSKVETVEYLPEMVTETDNGMEQERMLHAALERLPQDKRELLVMCKFQGLKYEQIAAIRATTVSAIKVQVHRTISQLRDIYFKYEGKEL